MDDQFATTDSEQTDRWRRTALEYLREQLREDAPAALGAMTLFKRSPLEGEGQTVVFEFTAARGGPDVSRYAVVVGDTEPNYYPAEDLTAEELFELHLGTRFMLVLGVSMVPHAEIQADDQYDMHRDARQIVARVAPDAVLSDLEPAATFRVGDELHAVLRCRLNGRPVYVMGRDAPLGFSTRTHLHPHVAYRLHLGHVLRREMNSDSSR
ncbi:MAG: hypothetical protein KF841_15735 [Phycisphaerae bacterium]|nr:hypothetical protein [Phycisphaerae bacterium]